MGRSKSGRNILLINPSNGPGIFQDYQFLNAILKTKCVAPPLPLLTVAGLIPEDFDIRLVDMNTDELRDEDLEWASLIFISGIELHRGEIKNLAKRCHGFGVLVVAGGLCVTRKHDDIDDVDCFVLGESEDLLPFFFRDYKNGRVNPVYRSETKPDLSRSPCPGYDLVDMENYNCAVLQWSRGCPHHCEFCQITSIYGRKFRHKSVGQFRVEMDALYATGYRGTLMLGDDNFLIGGMAEKMLIDLKEWQRSHGYPYSIFVQTDISMASRDKLMDLMYEAGFCAVQIGIESTSQDALRSVKKEVNLDQDLVRAVRKIHRFGIEVFGAILVGLDGDPENIFELQYEFLHEAGIPQVMISLLDVISGTPLYERYTAEGRHLGDFKGRNTGSFDLNYIPRMNPEKLISGYLKLTAETYKPPAYFFRCEKLLGDLRINPLYAKAKSKGGIKVLARFVSRTFHTPYFRYFLKFILKNVIVHWRKSTKAIELGIKGFQFYRMTREEIRKNAHIELSKKNWNHLISGSHP